jgi:hypothetical protein
LAVSLREEATDVGMTDLVRDGARADPDHGGICAMLEELACEDGEDRGDAELRPRPSCPLSRDALAKSRLERIDARVVERQMKAGIVVVRSMSSHASGPESGGGAGEMFPYAS